MRVIIAAVGRPKDEALAAAIREYEARAARYWPLHVEEIRAERDASATGASAVVREGERLMQRCGTAMLISCEVEGARMSSLAFADWLQAKREQARDVVFAIGGAFGLSAAVRQRASERLSLASWTLPHELARLVLAEQLYRAGTILRGEPYNK